ncbi:MAG: hypothetical protein J6K04_14040 [Lachnospiraceae bacterium]|nr:hypothetical protein [Lachnospiraceae bacterium]
MRKKLLSVLLCATMAVSMMAGCGKEETPDPTPTTAPTATTAPTEKPADPTAAPTEAPAPTEVPAVEAEALPEAVYYFPFDDATGLSARQNGAGANMDERVYPAEGVEFAFTNGVKGDALWLDGTFGAQVDGIEPLNKETYTISFWSWAARLSNYSTTLQFGNGMATGATEHWLSFTTLDAATAYPCIWSRWQPETGNVQPFPYYDDDAVYGRKKWAHFCLVVDETETVENSGAVILKAQLYVNGVPSENEIQVVPSVFTGDKATTDWRFLIGVNPWDKIFKGAIDELYIFDEALTPGQVATLYADGDGSSVPAKSTEPEPEVIRDYSATVATGTIVGNTDGSSVYGDAYSEIKEVAVGETVAVKFKNYVPSKLNAEGKNVYDFANTFSLILQNVAEGHSTADNADYKEYAVIAGSEGYEAAAKLSDLNVTRNTFHQFNPENFTTDSDLATFTVGITNYGETAKVSIKATCADTIIRYIDVEEIPVDGPLYYTLTTNGSFIDIAADDPVTGLVVGNTDCSTPFWTAFSDTVKVEVGTTKKLHFKNYTNGVENWNNFVVILQNIADAHAATETNGYKEYGVVRADNWGWGAGYDGIATAECNWNFDTFKSDMNGADVILEVTNNGTTADVVANVTTKAGATYTQKYTGIAIDGDLYYCLTVDGSWVEIKGTPVGTIDNATPFWTAFSDTVKVEAGKTERVYFKNYTNGAENWNNFVVILQNIADAHAADETNGYKEYGVVRADNWGWGAGYDGIATAECNWNFDTFKSDMAGADVVLDITNNGTTADVVATVTTKTGTVYTQKYTGIAIDGDLYFCLTVDGSFIDIIGSSVGAMDNSTPFWTAFSDTVKVEAGTTEYLKFRNYTNGAENWNNFVVILQNIADAHAADETNGYKEYGVVRADNWGWGAGYDGIATAECNWNFDTFKSDMAGALVDLAVTNNGTTADIIATVTTMNGTVYTQKYTGIAIDGDLYYCLTVDGSWISIFE